MASSSAKCTSLIAAGVLTGAGLVAVTQQSVLAAQLNVCQQVDNGDPWLESFSGTREVDVRTGDSLVTFGATAWDTGTYTPGTTDTIPDSVSGIRRIELTLRPVNRPTSYVVRLNRIGASDNFAGSFRVLRGAPQGDWLVDHLEIEDNAGNWITRSYDQLPSEESTLHVTSNPDTTPPAVSKLAVSPTRVDTTKKAKKVTFEARVSDAVAGVASVAAFVKRPPFGQVLRVPLRHVKGKTYKGTLRIPRWVGNARWVVTSLDVADRVKNVASVKRAGLAARGFPTKVNVRSGDESKRPRVTDFSLTPSSVDLTSGDVLVRVEAKARDNLSGVSSVRVWFQDDDIGFALDPLPLRRVSGTAKAGVWRGTLRLSRCTTISKSFRTELDIGDAASNFRFYGALPAGWSQGLTITRPDYDPPFPTILTGTVPSNGPVEVQFHELVEGVTEDTLAVEPLDDNFQVAGDPVPGTWTCTDTGDGTNCSFTPDQPFTSTRYQVQANPEHYLGLTDLAGNAPKRFVPSGFAVNFPP